MKKKSLLGKLFSGSTRDLSGEAKSMDRQYMAEQLEARVLYSAVPVDIGFPAVTVEEAPAEIKAEAPDGVGIQSLHEFGADAAISSGQSEIASDQMVFLLSFDYLSTEEVEQITSVAIERWRDSGISVQQMEVPKNSDISMLDMEGSVLGYAEGSHVFLDSDAADIEFVDSTPFDEVEFFFDENGILDAVIDLSPVSH